MDTQTAGQKAERTGLVFGFIGVLAFGLTLPATREAVAYFDPLLVGMGRVVVASVLAALLLLATRQRRPSREQWRGLVIVASGVGVGFPVLSAWALQKVPAAHGSIVLGLLPLATALFGALRAGERPSRGFWAASAVGSLTVAVFAYTRGAGQLHLEDLALVAAVVMAGLSYAEGGRLAVGMGGWQVICWALVLTGPFLVLPTAWALIEHGLAGPPGAWLGFGYVSLVSQFLGFFAWYRGLALGGIARVGQLQLLQPFVTIGAAALLLGEVITPGVLVAAAVVVGTIALGRKAGVRRNLREAAIPATSASGTPG
jgi:drug/metabolite transporter (DMT)-like permease